MSTPAEVIRQLLLDLSLGFESGDWSVYVSFLPDRPDSAICVYDTMGRQDGRIMATGEQIEHPGVQVRVRGQNYIETHAKATAIARALDLQMRTEVVISTEEAYRLDNVSRTSPIIPLGVEEEGDRRRHNFTINAVLTLQEI
jgi:hypothetical protein